VERICYAYRNCFPNRMCTVWRADGTISKRCVQASCACQVKVALYPTWFSIPSPPPPTPTFSRIERPRALDTARLVCDFLLLTFIYIVRGCLVLLFMFKPPVLKPLEWRQNLVGHPFVFLNWTTFNCWLCQIKSIQNPLWWLYYCVSWCVLDIHVYTQIYTRERKTDT